MKELLSILIFIFLISCNNKTEKNKNDQDSTIADQPQLPVSDPEICYMKVNGRDTVVLMLKQNGNNVNGKLLFDNYQYDGSIGTVSGMIEGEVIKLWYDFFAEGMHSVMEIHFKKEDDKLLRGMGDMVVKGDTSYFKTTADINYDRSETFVKADCTSVEGKFSSTHDY